MYKTNFKIVMLSAWMCVLLAGCAHPWVYVDESRASVLIVRGYIGSGELQRSPGCYEPMEEAVCGSPPRSDITFVIEQTLVGVPARKRLPVQFAYTQSWPELAKGREAQYLAVLTTDGKVSELHGVAPVARTIDGNWAVPITVQEDRPRFPCSREENSPEPLRFQPPGARQTFDEASFDESDAERLKDDDGYTVKEGYVYANKGVLLDRAATVYSGKPAAAVEGACEY